ncbi:MAG: type II toxin-antitoxin system death-on-curing family toxin [Roseiarcus sp.]
MNAPAWLAPDTVLDIQDELIAHFGGRAGLRDRGALEAALDLPRNKFAYGETRLSHLAAAYAFGLTRGHAFVDGNKRIGFAAMLVFLGLEGRTLRAPEPEATAMMFALAEGEVGEAQAAQWIERHV